MAVIINSGWTVYGNWYAAGYNYYQLNAWGINTFGQLGLSDVTNRSSPVQIGTSQLWTNAAPGVYHSLAIQSPGTLWSWGSNSWGQLGVNTFGIFQTSSPVQVQAPNVPLTGQWTSTSSAPGNGNSQLGIQTNGTLWAWGNNSFGMLGNNTSTQNNILSPIQIGALSNWSKVATGGYFNAAIQSPGTLWAWGSNSVGQLGINTAGANGVSSPVQVGSLSYWAQVACGFVFTAGVQSNGTLWTWGYNADGQLGINTLTLTYSSPVQVAATGSAVWRNIGTSVNNNQIGIQSNGTLWTWGNNSYGQLGNNTSTLSTFSSPVQVGTINYWTQAVTGSSFTMAIQSPGTLWSWGYNVNGQLGLNTGTAAISSPVQVGTNSNWAQISSGSSQTAAIQSNGTLWSWGLNTLGTLGLSDNTNRSSPTQIGGLSIWTQVALGAAHGAAIQSPGTLWTWGSNSYGQLGNNTTTISSVLSPVQIGALSNWAQVACGYYHTTAIQSNGTLWAWGLNQLGALAQNNTQPYSSPVQVGALSLWTQVSPGGFYTLALQTPGTLWSWGYDQYGQLGNNSVIAYGISSPAQVGVLSTWTQVTAQASSGSGLVSSGTLYAWGTNSYGQLGANTSGNNGVSTPVLVYSANTSIWSRISLGYNFVVAIQSNGTLWGWGNNSFGQLGINSNVGSLSPVQVGALSIWTQLANGWASTVALQSNGTLWAWGNNSQGQLGLNNGILSNVLSPVQIGALSNWIKIAGGGYHAIAAQSNGTLWAWGSNSYGQLGINTSTVTYSSPVQIGALSNWNQIGCGYFSTTAIQSNGTLYAWGTNTYGNLGINTSTLQYSSPLQVFSPIQGTWNQISAGGALTSAAIISPGTLWMWGYGNTGSLGNNSNTLNASSPIQVGLLSNWTQVATGYYTMAIQSPGTLWAWGTNSPYGNLGLNDITGRSSPVQVGSLSIWTQVSTSNSYNTIALQSNGTLWTWGNNSFGQLGLGDVTQRSSPVQVGALNTWTQVGCGYNTMAAIQSPGTLWVWGNNSFGQLGLNTSTLSSVLSPVQVGTTNYWTQISVGYGTMAAILSPGTLWAWGLNSQGQLGLNSTTSTSSPVQVGALTTWTSINYGPANGPSFALGIRYG